MKKIYLAIASAAVGLASCAAETMSDTTPATNEDAPAKSKQAPFMPADPSQIVPGNGVDNFIVLEDAEQDGATYIFKTVQIDRNGWLVMHPFKDSEPVRTVYVGNTYLTAGTHSDVSITVDPAPEPSEMYIVMLHYDMNDDQVFDFNDGVTVPDMPVFEGNTMVALRFVSPS